MLFFECEEEEGSEGIDVEEGEEGEDEDVKSEVTIVLICVCESAVIRSEKEDYR